MRTVKYRVTGTRQPNITAEGTVKELISWVGYVLVRKYIPPLSTMNDFFKRGHLSNGFNGDTYWEPFELRPNEYDALVAELLTDKKAGYQILDAPDWIATEVDWTAYTTWHDFGVPLEPHRQMLYEFRRLIDKQAKALAEGDRELASTLSTRLGEAAISMANYLEKYYR
jgi:hypothetical protein